MTAEDWALLDTILARCAVLPLDGEVTKMRLDAVKAELFRHFHIQRIYYPLPGGKRKETA